MKINPNHTTTGRELRIAWNEDGYTVDVRRGDGWLTLSRGIGILDHAATERARLSGLKPTLIRFEMRQAERRDAGEIPWPWPDDPFSAHEHAA